MSSYRAVQLLNPIAISTNIKPTGVYNAATTYGIGDSVSYGNSSYLCIAATTGNVPTNTAYWQLLASSATNKLTTTARNLTGATIPKMTVVYFSGVNGNLPTLALSQANGELSSTKTIGITATAIANNADGEVIIFGLADNLDTTAFAAGSALWLSPTVAGGMTVTKPSAPNHMVFIGFCTRSHPTSGTIEVKVQNGFELEELHNVAISSVANNQTLMYESATSLWKNHTLVKADVDLSNVDNTSDADKPVSAAQATAIGLKVDKAGDYLTGTLYSEGPVGAGYYNSLITSCADTEGSAQISFDSDNYNRLSIGIANSLFSPFLGILPDYAFQHSNVGYISIVDSLAGFKWVQSGNESASLAAGSFYANTMLSSPIVRVTAATASRVAVLDASKNIVSSTVSTTTLGYLDATSSVQTQLNSKTNNEQSIINALIFG